MRRTDELRELRNDLTRETDPVRREQIVSLIGRYIEVRWDKLFKLISAEDNPQRMLLWLAELNEIIAARRAQLTTKT